MYADAGTFGIHAGFDPEDADRVVRAIVEQLDRITTDPVRPEELDRARAYTRGRLELRMEDSRAVAGWNGGQEVLSRRVLSVDDIIRRLESVTTSGIQKLASELFRGSKLRLALVGPVEDAKKLEELLVL